MSLSATAMSFLIPALPPLTLPLLFLTGVVAAPDQTPHPDLPRGDRHLQ